MGIGLACQVFLEVVRQRSEGLLLTLDQALVGLSGRRQGRREIDTPNGEPGFHSGRRSDRYAELTLAIGRAAASVIDPSSHGVVSSCQTCGVDLNFCAGSDDLAAVGFPSEGKWVVVWVARRSRDAHPLTRMNRTWIHRAAQRWWTIGPGLHTHICRTARYAPATIIYSRCNGIAAGRKTSRTPTNL